jgi:hypothetical protein
MNFQYDPVCFYFLEAYFGGIECFCNRSTPCDSSDRAPRATQVLEKSVEAMEEDCGRTSRIVIRLDRLVGCSSFNMMAETFIFVLLIVLQQVDGPIKKE